MKEKRTKKIFWVLFYVLVFCFLIYNSCSYLDPDLGWHLEVGKEILAELAVPEAEYYNHTLEGKSWVDHEWALNAASYWIFDSWGYFALNLVFVFPALLTLVVLAWYTKRYFLPPGRGDFAVMVFQALGVICMAPHLGIRMQEMTQLFLVLLLAAIHLFSSGRRRILLLLPPLFVLWANLHAGFLIGIAVMAMWAGVKAAENIVCHAGLAGRLRFMRRVSWRDLGLFGVFIILSAAATLMNPYGLELYGFLKDYSNDFYLKAISEWLPFYYYPIAYKKLAYIALVASFLVIYAVNKFMAAKKKGAARVDVWHLALIFVFICLALKSRRHFPLFFAASFPWLTAMAVSEIPPWKFLFDLFRESRIVRFYITAGFLLASANHLITANYTSAPFAPDSPYCGAYPCAAIEAMRSDPEIAGKKLFNNYGWGGFMIRVWPEKQLFIDGRLPFYDFAGHSLLEEYVEFFKEDKTGGKLDEYDIEMVHFRLPQPVDFNWAEEYIFSFNEEDINSQPHHMKEYLEESAEWKKLFGDEISEVYVRNSKR